MLAVFATFLFLFGYGSSTLIVDRPNPVDVQMDGVVSQPRTLNHCSVLSSVNSHDRLIAIGDIHGSIDGLLADLFAANLTTSRSECRWKYQPSPTTLVQMGDLTDRGPGALESLQCLHELQKTAAENNAKVVRLLGNHELWWLEGIFHQRNPRTDTVENIRKFLQILIQDIADGNVVASYLHHVGNVPIVFVHAGFHAEFLRFIQQPTVESLVQYVNQHLEQVVALCTSFPCNAFTHELYQAGPSRGGNGIGGPYWTDFSQLEAESTTRIATNN